MTKHLLLRTLAGEPTWRPPVWAMRQAGRWDPEFKKLRGSLDFFAFADRADLAAQASLLPRRFGVDAIILFYDITTLPIAMGLPFDFAPDQGPLPTQPIRHLADVEKLSDHPDPERYRSVLEVLRLVRQELSGALPVLVFAGAPFTVASYCLGTGKNVDATSAFAISQSSVFLRLLRKLETATIHFLTTLLAAGADAYQLFDSWAGELLARDYRRWAQPYHETIFAAVNQAPSILFVKEGPHLDLMAASGATAVSLGVRHDLAQARRDYPRLVFQGNVDETILRDGTVADVIGATRRCVVAGAAHRHVVNLNHGVDRHTPPENFAAFVSVASDPATLNASERNRP